MKGLSMMSSYDRAALGDADSSDVVQVVPAVSNGGAVQIAKLLPWQSYFDSTLLEKALATQRPNQLIISPVESTFRGYLVGLHPSSQTPVAVQFKGLTAPLILKPGQIVRPNSDGFDMVTWGLPFGWLGGGLANLWVFQTRETWVSWSENCDIPFHRARFAIKAPTNIASNDVNNASKNWPSRFPWTQALQGSNSVPQKGAPQVAIAELTRIIMALQGATALSAPAPMQMRLQGTNVFGTDSTDTVDLTSTSVVETITWPAFDRLGTSGNMRDVRPTIEHTGPVTRLGADDGGAVLVDVSADGVGGDLAGLFVDIVRYGRL